VLLIGWYSFKRKSVSVSGLAALVIISNIIIWLDEMALLLTLFYMFASSSALSGIQKKQKHETESVISKSGPRDYIQALANLGVATVCIVAFRFFQDPVLIVAAIGSVAAGNADSWASEIGSFSKQDPVSITTFKPLPKGISGGVTILGTLAGFAGSLFVVLASVFTIQLLDKVTVAIFPVVISTCIAGFSGMLFDSYIGALFQALYKNKETSGVTEIPEENLLLKGYRWMNNDMVNFLSTLFGGIMAGMIYLTISYLVKAI